MRAVIAGVIGGAIGAVVWAVVAGITGYEVGWIAWGIGGVVGYAVAFGNRDGSIAPTPAGVVAVVLSVLSIVAGKYLTVQFLIPDDAEMVSMFTAELDDEELLISYMADEIVEERESAGEVVAWAEDVDPDYATTETEYPTDIWSEAESRWTDFSAEAREDFRLGIETEIRTNLEAQLPELRELMGSSGFWGSFGGMDVVFFGLAMVTAFGIGNGSKEKAARVTEAYPDAMKRALVGVMLADGHIDAGEVQAIKEIYHELTGTPLSDEEVHAEAALIQSDDRDPLGDMRELAADLIDEGKEQVIGYAFRVALADGRLDESEGAYLTQVARCVGLSRSRFQELLEGLTAESMQR